jgi:hypothetical protein
MAQENTEKFRIWVLLLSDSNRVNNVLAIDQITKNLIVKHYALIVMKERIIVADEVQRTFNR